MPSPDWPRTARAARRFSADGPRNQNARPAAFPGPQNILPPHHGAAAAAAERLSRATARCTARYWGRGAYATFSDFNRTASTELARPLFTRLSARPLTCHVPPPPPSNLLRVLATLAPQPTAAALSGIALLTRSPPTIAQPTAARPPTLLVTPLLSPEPQGLSDPRGRPMLKAVPAALISDRSAAGAGGIQLGSDADVGLLRITPAQRAVKQVIPEAPPLPSFGGAVKAMIATSRFKSLLTPRSAAAGSKRGS